MKSKLLRVTVDKIMSWHPCEDYPRERVQALWGERQQLSLREIAALDIPREDVWWVICNAATDRQCRHLACWCALQVLPSNAPEVVRRYLETEDESIRGAARDAARDAWYAARDAAWYAALDAAWDAARDAALAAARDAAWYAARDAARGRQIAYALEYLAPTEGRDE